MVREPRPTAGNSRAVTVTRDPPADRIRPKARVSAKKAKAKVALLRPTAPPSANQAAPEECVADIGIQASGRAPTASTSTRNAPPAASALLPRSALRAVPERFARFTNNADAHSGSVVSTFTLIQPRPRPQQRASPATRHDVAVDRSRVAVTPRLQQCVQFQRPRPRPFRFSTQEARIGSRLSGSVGMCPFARASTPAKSQRTATCYPSPSALKPRLQGPYSPSPMAVTPRVKAQRPRPRWEPCYG